MQSRQLVVPKGSDVKVLVKPRMKTDVEGALSNQQISLFVTKEPLNISIPERV
jgi:hypothetical protein